MKKLLLLIILAGLALRLYGAGHGLHAGRIFHPDTPKQARFLNSFLEGDYRVRFRTSLPDLYGYPVFHIHLAEWTHRGIGLIAGMTGFPDWKLDSHGLWILMRVMTALFSAATAVFVYLAGKTLFSERAGIVSAALFSVHPFSVGMSHFIMGDTAMVFFAVIAFYFFSLCFLKQRAFLFLLGGLFVGFSAACKYNGGFMAIPGLFLLFIRPGKRTAGYLFSLALGGALGFTIGNPSMFSHFSEALRAASSFLGYVGDSWWDTSQHRLVAAALASPRHFRVFINLFGLLQLAALGASTAWILKEKRGMKAVFVLIFPLSYLGASIVSQPYSRAPLMLVLVPFFLLPAGWFLAEAFKGNKLLRAAGAAILALLLVSGAYCSWRESFLFISGDTRLSADEWLERNIPGYFTVVRSPFSGRGWRFRKSRGEEGAGGVYIHSSLSWRAAEESGAPVKKFSHEKIRKIENADAWILHRNPDLEISALYGKHLAPGFSLPVFNRPPHFGKTLGPLNAGGVDFGLDPLKMFTGRKNELRIVSLKPLDEIVFLVVGFDIETEVSVRVSGKTKTVKIPPFETKIIVFKNPRRLPPFDRYCYGITVEKAGPRVFCAAAFSQPEKGLLYFAAGDYEKAAGHLSALCSHFCPAELAVLRAYSFSAAGKSEEAAGLARAVSYWGEDYARIDEEGEDEELFRSMHLDRAGISVEFLESVNTVRFSPGDFNSIRGGVKLLQEGDEPVPAHLIDANDLIHGPYMPFPSGNYRARFLIAAGTGSPESIIRLDVSSSLGTKILAEKEIPAREIGEKQEFVLKFRIDESAEFLEFRTALEGNGELSLYGVEVFPDFRQNTLDKAGMLEKMKQAK